MSASSPRGLPVPSGATVTRNGVRFAVWAPNAARLDVQIETGSAGETAFHPLALGQDGRFAGEVAGIGAGTRYRFRLHGEHSYPDPYARFQPEGVHGPSEVINPAAFVWTDDAWPGLEADDLVIYECHTGTMTPEGTFLGLIGQLPELKRLGINAIELMPVATCPGRWNWGYDGVNLFAPSPNYGRPDDLRHFVDAAHAQGLGVLLDVVYNHLGPDGNYLRAFAGDYFTDRHTTPWGDALNYDGPHNHWVRQFAIQNAVSWITEFHIDGLRLDATDTIIDDSPTHIVAELTERVRRATQRGVVVIAEDARNDVRRIQPVRQGGEGLDAVWADDFHHEMRVYLTGARENYYADFQGTTNEVARTIEQGFGYQGQRSPSTGKARGTKVTGEPAHAFVFCIQNHDQIGNRPFGERLHHEIDAARYATASAVLLFLPETPLLFMGQEFAATTPFLYFTDHEPELGQMVTQGRRKEFAGFGVFSDAKLRDSIPDPQLESSFTGSKLKYRDRRINAGIYRLYRALIALRRTDPVLVHNDRTHVRAEALTAQVIVIHRWWGAEQRLILANFGAATQIKVSDAPFLARLPVQGWRIVLNTASRSHDGSGERACVTGRGASRTISLPARSATIFRFTG